MCFALLEQRGYPRRSCGNGAKPARWIVTVIAKPGVAAESTRIAAI
jgi:hypothetical protein